MREVTGIVYQFGYTCQGCPRNVARQATVFDTFLVLDVPLNRRTFEISGQSDMYYVAIAGVVEEILRIYLLDQKGPYPQPPKDLKQAIHERHIATHHPGFRPKYLPEN